jgi:hypothetical protein
MASLSSRAASGWNVPSRARFSTIEIRFCAHDDHTNNRRGTHHRRGA